MVQILNKIVHLKYPILKIWCCHKHITQLPPSRLKFNTKLRKVFRNTLAPQLCTSHSCRENIAPNFVCLFQPIKCKQVKLRFWQPLALVSLLKCLLKAQMWQKAEEYIPSRFVSTALHKSLLQAKYVDSVLYVNFECLFWPIKCMHSKPGFWGHFSHFFTS